METIAFEFDRSMSMNILGYNFNSNCVCKVVLDDMDYIGKKFVTQMQTSEARSSGGFQVL